jgi:methyl-accepting chemotaxis protein/methyl-accepting chemotaxis protein-1 (serine sensor receptor)
MDQTTQQNAAMVEETNAASHTLVTEITSLSSRLGQFNLGGGARTMQAASHTHARPAAATSARPVAQPTPKPASRPAPARTPVAATERARPAPSPARALGNKIAAAFNAAPAAAASSGGDWEEF